MNPIYKIKTDDQRVKDAIAKLQASGAPAKVELFDGDELLPVQIHTVTFIAPSGNEYTGIAGLIALYPGVALTEMKAAGIIA